MRLQFRRHLSRFVLVALRNPRLVRTLVLAEPPVITLFASTPPKPLELLRLLVTRPRIAASIIKFGTTGIGPATAAARRGDMDAALRIFGTAVLGPEFYRRLSATRLEQVRANAIAAEFLGSGMTALDEQDLRGLQTPTLLLTGQLSPRLFHHLTDRLSQLLPQARRVEIPGASHIVHEDNPHAYNAAVLSFLADHQAA
jgi:pimeloyl-ACP methyl ester carboxylesterase